MLERIEPRLELGTEWESRFQENTRSAPSPNCDKPGRWHTQPGTGKLARAREGANEVSVKATGIIRGSRASVAWRMNKGG